MKVSVIVPVYNTEKYLKNCIDSLLKQNFENYEIIVINDLSPGNAEEIIKSYNDQKIVKYKFIEMAALYVINRKYYLDNNFMFEKDVYHEDYGLLPLVIATAKKVKSINYLGYNYVQRDGSIMSSNDTEKMKKKMDDMLFLFTKAIKYLDNIPNSQNVKSFYANSIIDKYNSLSDELKKEYIKKIKDLKIISYLSNDNFKRKIKKILYKIKYEVLK